MKLALQLSSFKDILKRDWREAVQKAAEAGYTHLELSGVLGESDTEARTALDAAGLRVVGVHYDYQELYGRLEPLLGAASILGAEWVIVNHLQLHQWADGWDRAGESIGKLAAAAQEHGLKTAYNTHKLEFNMDEGCPALERLLDAAGPSLKVDFDVYWAHDGGNDPAEWIQRLGPRVSIVHLNDEPGLAGGTSIDNPPIDWQKVMDATRVAGVEWGVIERGSAQGEPEDGARASRERFLALGAE